MINLARSSYYYKTKEPNANKQIGEANIRDRIEQILCECPGYGRPRVTKELKRQGFDINHKRVRRIMRENNLLCVVKRAWFRTTNSNHPYKRYPNLIKNMVVIALNQLWVSDITYILP